MILFLSLLISSLDNYGIQPLFMRQNYKKVIEQGKYLY